MNCLSFDIDSCRSPNFHDVIPRDEWDRRSGRGQRNVMPEGGHELAP